MSAFDVDGIRQRVSAFNHANFAFKKGAPWSTSMPTAA